MLPWSFSEEGAAHMAQLQHNMWLTNTAEAGSSSMVHTASEVASILRATVAVRPVAFGYHVEFLRQFHRNPCLAPARDLAELRCDQSRVFFEFFLPITEKMARSRGPGTEKCAATMICSTSASPRR